MKWVTKGYQGNKQVWYSADVIEKIYKLAKECNYLDDREAISNILNIIESENNDKT